VALADCTSVRWDCLRTDANLAGHVLDREWPRVEVGRSSWRRCSLGRCPPARVSDVVMEPSARAEPPARSNKRARPTWPTASSAPRRLPPTARRAREAELVERREAELADGHASFRFSGYVTVTAPTPSKLAEICETTEQAAGQAASSSDVSSATRNGASRALCRCVGDWRDGRCADRNDDRTVLCSRGSHIRQRRRGRRTGAAPSPRSPAMRGGMGAGPRVPAHQVTTRNLGAAYPSWRGRSRPPRGAHRS